MEIKFIGQGLNNENHISTGDIITQALQSNKYNQFKAFVAFTSTSGINNILDSLISFQKNNGDICLYLGIDLNATSKEALELLLENNIESYIVYSPNSIIYHPKIYTFEGTYENKAIIGSSNLTASGLYQNIEAATSIKFSNDYTNGREFLSDIYDYFNGVINQTHPSCTLLTQEVLNTLITNKIVLSQATIFRENNQKNKDYKQVDSEEKAKLLT